FSQMAHILAIRSERRSLFRAGLFSNKPLLAAVCLTIVLQLALLYVAGLRQVFRTKALSPVDLAATAAFAAVIFCAVELEKYLLQRKTVLKQEADPAVTGVTVVGAGSHGPSFRTRLSCSCTTSFAWELRK